MSALLTLDLFPLQKYLYSSVSTSVSEKNERHFKMKEDRAREGSGGQQRKIVRTEKRFRHQTQPPRLVLLCSNVCF